MKKIVMLTVVMLMFLALSISASTYYTSSDGTLSVWTSAGESYISIVEITTRLTAKVSNSDGTAVSGVVSGVAIACAVYGDIAVVAMDEKIVYNTKGSELYDFCVAAIRAYNDTH